LGANPHPEVIRYSSAASAPLFDAFTALHLLRAAVLLTEHQSPKNMNTLKSIGAVLAGLIFIGVTHSAIDAMLEAVGVLPKDNLYVSTPLILFVIFYRALFSLFGCYLTAKLAPKNPMTHSLILGGIGTAGSLAGAIITADMNLGPAWYAWSLVIIAMPIAWLAGKIYFARNLGTQRAR
jgi:hypothetical protein